VQEAGYASRIVELEREVAMRDERLRKLEQILRTTDVCKQMEVIAQQSEMLDVLQQKHLADTDQINNLKREVKRLTFVSGRVWTQGVIYKNLQILLRERNLIRPAPPPLGPQYESLSVTETATVAEEEEKAGGDQPVSSDMSEVLLVVPDKKKKKKKTRQATPVS
jgi:hypothetical protein